MTTDRTAGLGSDQLPVDPEREEASTPPPVRVPAMLAALAYRCAVWLVLAFTLGCVGWAVALQLPGVDFGVEVSWMIEFAAALLSITFFAAWAGTRRPDGALLAARRVWGWVRVVVDELGLLPGRNQWVTIVGIGSVAVVADLALAIALTRIPALASPADDIRYTGVENSPLWAGALAFALAAPLLEEMLYRGPLLLLAASVDRSLPTDPGARRAMKATVLVLTSLLFAWAHLEYSIGNAVTSGVSALVFGLAALRARSIWAGILAHALFNLIVGLSTI